MICLDGLEIKFIVKLSIIGKYEYLDKWVVFVFGFFFLELIGNLFYEYCYYEDFENLLEYYEILFLIGKLIICYYWYFIKG